MRIIAIVGAVVALCVGAVGACFYLERPYDSCPQVEPGVPFAATFEEVLQTNVGHYVSLDEVAQFDWDRVLIFSAYTPAQTVEEKTGHLYLGDLLFREVPENETLLAFMKHGAQVCRLSWRWGWIEGRDPPSGYLRGESRFKVEKYDGQVTPHLVPDAV